MSLTPPLMTDVRVLLVDDHDFTRALERRVLTDLGVTQVTEASNGLEALARARAARPDIVISDLNMPGMDGMTFISHLAKHQLADSVIITSGLAPGVLKAVGEMASAAGIRVLGTIEKPMRKDALASMLYLHSHPGGGAATDSPTLGSESVERAVELGQFKAVFAPLLDVATMRVVMVDVVPRWESPEFGLKVGDAGIAPLMALPAASAVLRSLVQSSLSAGGLWRQMGWNGVLTLPSGLAAAGDSALWDWLPGAIRKIGAQGTVALRIDGALFVEDPARGAFAVARGMMDRYYIDVRLTEPEQLEAIATLAACNFLTFPVSWISGLPDTYARVHDLAERLGADLGASGVDTAALLGNLSGAQVRLAQGEAIGRAASAAATYDAYLAAN